eukprot:TRINITY_DN23948_c0_g1_i1.p1 TRINITY_DN23948_c0_g1~~TRINITY_DN23948_c0_g1_i1.p1  ORF type:complete len:500 (+),score=59.49 TRINITY_DN23948_c0_g1_i1:67-1500(+)
MPFSAAPHGSRQPPGASRSSSPAARQGRRSQSGSRSRASSGSLSVPRRSQGPLPSPKPSGNAPSRRSGSSRGSLPPATRAQGRRSGSSSRDGAHRRGGQPQPPSPRASDAVDSWYLSRCSVVSTAQTVTADGSTWRPAASYGSIPSLVSPAPPHATPAGVGAARRSAAGLKCSQGSVAAAGRRRRAAPQSASAAACCVAAATAARAAADRGAAALFQCDAGSLSGWDGSSARLRSQSAPTDGCRTLICYSAACSFSPGGYCATLATPACPVRWAEPPQRVSLTPPSRMKQGAPQRLPAAHAAAEAAASGPRAAPHPPVPQLRLQDLGPDPRLAHPPPAPRSREQETRAWRARLFVAHMLEQQHRLGVYCFPYYRPAPAVGAPAARRAPPVGAVTTSCCSAEEVVSYYPSEICHSSFNASPSASPEKPGDWASRASGCELPRSQLSAPPPARVRHRGPGSTPSPAIPSAGPSPATRVM